MMSYHRTDPSLGVSLDVTRFTIIIKSEVSIFPIVVMFFRFLQAIEGRSDQGESIFADDIRCKC